MLEVVHIESRSDIKGYLKKIQFIFDPLKVTWLVGDLRTKKDYQNLYLENNSHFFDESVLRASDLWQLFLKRNEPSLKIVSDSFAQVLLKKILDQNSEVLGINQTSDKSILNYLKVLAPLLFHAESSTVILDWFDKRPESAQLWKSWYLRSKFCAEILIHQEKVLLREWVVPFLLERYIDRLTWDKKIYVDLGGKISQSEGELLRTLSRVTDVIVFAPTSEWHKSFDYLLKPYSYLVDQSQQHKNEHKTEIEKEIESAKTEFDKQGKSPSVYRFSGALAEVKHAVATVRKWIEEGKNLDSICITSPDIEKYWPCLHAFLEKGGIPCQKDEVTKLHSLLDVKTWLSKIRSIGSSPTFEDIQLAYYNQENELMRFEVFESLFKNIYRDSDLCRNRQIENLFYKKINPNQFLSAQDFMAQSLKYWSGENDEAIVLLASEIHKNASPHHLLKWSSWVNFTEAIASQIELVIQKGSSNGLVVESLSSAQSWHLDHRIFIGLDDEGLRSSNQTLISPADVLSLSSLYGFYLDQSDQGYFDFQVRWLTESNFTGQTELVFANTDFKGSLQTVSKVWLEYLMKSGLLSEFEKLSIPERTRWDYLQDRFKIQSLDQEGESVVSQLRIKMDLGEVELPPIQSSTLCRISPTSLDRWYQCPFLIACDQIFNLQKFPELDMDLDAMTKGKIYHYLYYKLTEPPFAEKSVEEIEGFLEEFKKENQQNFTSQEFWAVSKKKYLDSALRFLAYEGDLRRNFSLLKTVGRESEFKFYINPDENLDSEKSNLQIAKTAMKGFIRVSGRIDRIDSDGLGNLVVIDYKSSLSSKHSVSNWIRDRHFQLLLYGWAIENDFVDEISGSIVGLFFQSVKNFERKGFQDNDGVKNLFYPSSKNKKNKENSKNELYSQFIEFLNKTGLALKSGLFEPKPMNKEICENCEYRGLCRATHLN